MERFELFAFAHIETLADINERRHGGIERTQSAGDNRAEMRRSHCLWRRVAGMPLVLMAGVEDEAEVAGGIGADQGAAIHDGSDFFETLSEFDVVDRGIDRRERAEKSARRHAFLERSVTLWIEGFGVSHAAAHPEDNYRIGSGFSRFGGCFVRE